MKLYQKYPGLDSCAAVPLFVTGVYRGVRTDYTSDR